MKRNLTTIVLATTALIWSVSCSSNDDDNDDTAATTTTTTATTTVSASTDATSTIDTEDMTLATSLTILPAKTSSSASLTASRTVSFRLASDAPRINLRTSIEAFEPIEQAASILCFLAQSNPKENVNDGPFQMQIDNNLCDTGDKGEGEEQQGSSGSGQEQNLDLAYFDVTREENRPMVVDFAVTGDEEGSYYHGRLIVVEPPSDSYPAGIVKMNFTERDSEGTMGEYGFIETAEDDGIYSITVNMTGSGGGSEFSMAGRANIVLDEDGEATGKVVAELSDESDEESFSMSHKVNFDADYVNMDGSQAGEGNWGSFEEEIKGCFDRNSFKTNIFRYKLVHDAAGTYGDGTAYAAGDEVKLNGGFPAEIEIDGETKHAYVGYHGIWAQGEPELESGTTITKVDWSSGEKETEEYTTFVAPGKLIKLTKETVTLEDLVGVDLEYWEDGTNYLVQWDGDNNTFNKVGKMEYSEDGPPTESSASGEVEIPQWGLHLWIPSLNSSVNFSANESYTNASEVPYHAEEVVSATASDLGNLYCFKECPVMAPSESDFERDESEQSGPRTSSLYKTTSVTWGDESFTTNQVDNISTIMATYTFNETTKTLAEDGTDFALPTFSSSSNEQEGGSDMQNIWSGALIPAATYDAISDKGIDPHRVEGQVDVYYRWVSGARSWNRFQGIKDADGNFVTFDKPMEISFTLTSDMTFDGISDTNIVDKTYRISYEGPGEIHGIPHKYNANVGHYMPLFSLGGVDENNLSVAADLGDYSIYPIEGDQRLVEVDESNCSSLSFNSVPEVPEAVNAEIDNTDIIDDSVRVYTAED